MFFPDGQEKKESKRERKKTLQGDDGWFSSAYPRWPPTKKADGKGEIVNAQKKFLILWFLQFSICSIWNIYLSNKVITRMSCLWGYWQPTELTFQSYRILPSKSYCTGFKFRVICQGETKSTFKWENILVQFKPPSSRCNVFCLYHRPLLYDNIIQNSDDDKNCDADDDDDNRNRKASVMKRLRVPG